MVDCSFLLGGHAARSGGLVTLACRWLRHALLVILGLHCLPALGASPSFDCGRAEGEVQKLVCQDPRLAELDRELARLFGLARADQHTTGSDPAALAVGERGWIERRDACRNAGDMRECVVASYAGRIAEIRRSHAGARSQDDRGISLGPFAARCDRLDALIEVTFINGKEEPALANLEWLDQALVVSLGPSGSGARYTGGYGGGTATFWNKGDEALFELPGQPQRQCRIEKIG